MMRQYLVSLMTDQMNDPAAIFVKWNLAIMARLYGWAIHGRNEMYNKGLFPRHSLPKPVISVGNLTVGGVGKTPLVAMIGRYLLQQKQKPAILIRGYHSVKKNQGWESDEAVFLRESLPGVPVMIGRDRLTRAREALSQQDISVFLLDDGFQHRRISRDLDIVAIDATNPFGNGELIPRGLLREPVASLKRARLVVLTKSDWGKDNLLLIEKVLNDQGIRVPVVHAVHRPSGFQGLGGAMRSPADIIKNKPVCLLSGIGDPKGFERMVQSLQADVRNHYVFPDHYWFKEKDIDDVLAFCLRERGTSLITTGKDAVRLRPFAERMNRSVHCLILMMHVEITHGTETFFKRIDCLFRR